MPKRGNFMALVEHWSKVGEDGLVLLENWVRDGLKDEEMAFKMGLSLESFLEWKKRQEGMAEALQKGELFLDAQVERALFKLAVGYRYEEITYDELGQEKKRVTKEVSPNLRAQIFWLKNRRAELWGDGVSPPSEEDSGNFPDFSGLSLEDLRELSGLYKKA